MLSSVSQLIDKVTGVEGSFGYVVILVLVVVGYTWTGSYMTSTDRVAAAKAATDEVEQPDPARNFTVKQLRHFDGSKEPKSETALKPVYLSLNGTVFDVSGGRDFYGPGGPYEKFAGRECGIALAKMSFDEEHLDNLKGCAELNFGEKNQLDEWHEKFKYYRNYPVMGRLVVDLPSPDRVVTPAELAAHSGSQSVPAGYAAAPIYIGAGTKVFDVSFGGVTAYGPNGPYHKFAGKNVSRALATMSLDDATVNSTHMDDLTEKQLTTMNEWITTFEEKKLYPVVGTLQKE